MIFSVFKIVIQYQKSKCVVLDKQYQYLHFLLHPGHVLSLPDHKHR